MGLPMGCNSCLSPCRWFSWADDIPSVFTGKKPKTPCFPFTLFFHHSCRKPSEKKHPARSSSFAGNLFLPLKHGFLLASSVRELNWKISCILSCCSQRLHVISEEWLLSLKMLIKTMSLSMVPLLSCTCIGLVALIPPTRKARVDMHTGTLLACLCSWLVSWVKV